MTVGTNWTVHRPVVLSKVGGTTKSYDGIPSHLASLEGHTVVSEFPILGPATPVEDAVVKSLKGPMRLEKRSLATTVTVSWLPWRTTSAVVVTRPGRPGVMSQDKGDQATSVLWRNTWSRYSPFWSVAILMLKSGMATRGVAYLPSMEGESKDKVSTRIAGGACVAELVACGQAEITARTSGQGTTREVHNAAVWDKNASGNNNKDDGSAGWPSRVTTRVWNPAMLQVTDTRKSAPDGVAVPTATALSLRKSSKTNDVRGGVQNGVVELVPCQHGGVEGGSCNDADNRGDKL